MRTTRLLLAAALMVAPFFSNAQSVYDTFDDVRTVNYGLDIPFSDQIGNGIGGTEWPGWHGTFIQYDLNPGPDDVNDSPMCAQYVRNASEFYDVILVHPGLMADVGDYVSGAKTMSFDVFSPLPGITVQITLENELLAMGGYPEGRHSEYTAVTTTGGEWETLEFTLSGQPWTEGANAGWWPTAAEAHVACDQMVILYAPASNSADVYYMDNLNGPERVDEPCADVNTDEIVLMDADCENDRFIKEYCDGRLSIFPDPLNAENNVLEYARNGGAADDVIVGNFNGALEIGVNAEMRIDLLDLAPPSSLVFSIQDAFGTELAQFNLTSTLASEWQTLTMDLAALEGLPNATNFVMLFEPGQLVVESYYIDNLVIESVMSVEDEGVASITVYPNPSNGLLNLVNEGVSKIANLEVLNLAGQIVYSSSKLTNSVDLSFLSEGVYFVKIQTESGAIATERVLIH